MFLLDSKFWHYLNEELEYQFISSGYCRGFNYLSSQCYQRKVVKDKLLKYMSLASKLGNPFKAIVSNDLCYNGLDRRSQSVSTNSMTSLIFVMT